MQILCKSNAKLRGNLHSVISLLIVHKVFAQFALRNLLTCCFENVYVDDARKVFAQCALRDFLTSCVGNVFFAYEHKLFT